ncbi:methyltransferase [Methanosarcina spelaei]|uniref:Methyltransferase n=1 Tax=Methanosarcina spelaei TaxID=1036679 RepID=A0A2A2HXQ5_9EURY|nr:nicotianamine synthase family protein [Methanosarcina spelaei]PAV14084.1 methyltransferase [Methanosarcina spelaei]
MVSAIGESSELSEVVLKEILDLYKDIRKLSDEEILSSSSDKSKKLFLKLDALITQDLDSCVVSILLNKQELEPIFVNLNRFRNLYTVKLETGYAKEVLASQSPWDVLEEFPFYKNYLKLVRTEYEGFGLKAGDRIFFLGSGPLPLTLIVFFKYYGVKGTGIEQNPERAKLSTELLDKLGLSKEITILNGTHYSMNPIDFLDPDTRIRALVIAAQAEPKKEILDYLLTVMPAGCRISHRVYEKGLMKLLNRDFLLDLPEGYREYKRIRPEPPAYNTVIFLEKKSNYSGIPEY